MAHKEQRSWAMQMAAMFPDHFNEKTVLDIGSWDINGNTRHLFRNCFYLGLDIHRGPNVDILWNQDFAFNVYQDVYISCEALEHSKSWDRDFAGMIKYSKNMVVMTCAAPPRPIHGTKETTPEHSPYTTDYYRNLTQDDLEPLVKGHFYWYKFFYNPDPGDIYFIGFKKKPELSPSIFRYIWLELRYFLFYSRPRDFKNALARVAKIWSCAS